MNTPPYENTPIDWDLKSGLLAFILIFIIIIGVLMLKDQEHREEKEELLNELKLKKDTINHLRQYFIISLEQDSVIKSCKKHRNYLPVYILE